MTVAGVAAYVEQCGDSLWKPTVKQHLAAVRMLSDWLVIGQVVPMNPASAVRGPKQVVRRGKTPILPRDETRTLLDSIRTDTIVGLRDRALIAVFRTLTSGTAGRPLSLDPMAQSNAWRMIRRRSKAAGIETEIGCHTFKATGITAYLENGGTLEHAQQIAAHESPRTTKLYDRTSDQISLDEIERIAI